jgi:hypothetical protein
VRIILYQIDMSPLTFETLINTAVHDIEQCQYRVLEYTKHCTAEFGKNKLYPVLAELIELAKGLENFLERKNSFYAQLPQRIKEIDLGRQEIVFESEYIEHPDLARIEEVIRWTESCLKQIIEEGIRIYEFVDENVSVEGVGIVPIYKDEGYCIVPERRVSLVHFVYYQMSLYTSDKEKFRALKTTIIGSRRQTLIASSPISLKQDIISQHADLPNPATYMCETDLDFPFQETIMPIVKRKLLSHISTPTIQ